MTEVIAFLGGSDAANSPGWMVYFLIIFLIFAIPVIVIAGLIFLLLRSFRNKQTSSEAKKASGLNIYPIIFVLTGAVFLIANIGGSKYSDKSLVLDSILLALPFLLGALATLRRFPKEKRKIFLVLTFITALVFLYNHYPRWF